VGFRPLSSLKLGHHVKLPQFLYPCEDLVKGSAGLFAALLLRCHERQVAAVCGMKQRSVSAPGFVALVAQPEQLDEAGVQVKPPGFHVIHLPFLDDFRPLPQTRLRKDCPRWVIPRD
jgi:ATP-dependent DNA helicase 2 subunit 1